MSRLTLRLPETLHQQLALVAEQEGVSLNQYIVYALTRQTVNAPLQGLNVERISVQPDAEADRQKSSFQTLKDGLGEASSVDIERILAARKVVTSDPELTTDTIERLRAKIHAPKH
jgi:HicB family